MRVDTDKMHVNLSATDTDISNHHSVIAIKINPQYDSSYDSHMYICLDFVTRVLMTL